MTPDEYQQLVGFIGGKLDGLHGQIGGLQGQVGGLQGQIDGLHVLHEEQAHRLQVVAEGVTSLGQVVDRRFGEVHQEFAEVHQEFALQREVIGKGFRDHGARITALDRRVDRLERGRRG